MKQIFFSIFLAFFLAGCSGFVQTNKIPNETKYNLPKNIATLKNENLDSETLAEFANALESFFKTKKDNLIINGDEKATKNIYSIGIERKYFK